MEEERTRVLEMLRDGKISVDEALKLLDAVASTHEPTAEAPKEKAKWLRLRVTELGKEKPKVSMNVPVGILDWALKTGNKFAGLGGVDLDGMGINLNELRASLLEGTKGKIVDVVDEEEGHHVEITIE